ncbi:DnaA regulatory inactivator Hda [Agarilytica rhodophyticola]|uniref:DnaA regulatory inactivator Hda n=1 Tax=Agarilytica rhodophyticola TaxID=1737490 RepID=UPI000B348EB8|nr:DnaA regulatory inactivator Hda [Agarilytica rhodophyticola]
MVAEVSLSPSPMQLSLGVSLRDEATFANFYSEDNGLALSVMRAIASGDERSHHVIWGASGCGLTHLMQAVCLQAHEVGRSVKYFPMADIVDKTAKDILAGLDTTELICLDNIEVISGQRSWEVEIFHLFNRLRDAGHTLLMGMHTSPAELGIELPDLKSRILGCPIYRIESLNDEQKQKVLIMRADARGLKMPIDVAKYILNHASRDMNDLFKLLNQLDDASMQQQRKLTIPFVKQAFENNGTC